MERPDAARVQSASARIPPGYFLLLEEGASRSGQRGLPVFKLPTNQSLSWFGLLLPGARIHYFANGVERDSSLPRPPFQPAGLNLQKLPLLTCSVTLNSSWFRKGRRDARCFPFNFEI